MKYEQSVMDLYNKAYDNDYYAAVCHEIARLISFCRDISINEAKTTGDYDALTNMVTDLALEECGMAFGESKGWLLADSLLKIIRHSRTVNEVPTKTVFGVFDMINGYLSVYKHAKKELEQDGQ